MSTIILCRTCELELSLAEEQDIVSCPACGTRNARPQADADTQEMLRRATRQRLRCDFVHAESSYQYVLRESPEEHEALWGITLCRYGVEYVEDAKTGRRLPVVHAVRRRPMLTDPDFREACDLAPEAVREQYRQEAGYIDGAMARIRELAARGEKYDIFLCHKTSRTDGQEGYTEDFKRATQLYMKLEKAGYSVFFAPFAGLTPGENYEAGIYHALDTARVMLVVCSNAEYINSPWVRTEWQRFLEMSYEPGADKHLIPLLYDGFPPRRLPDDFRLLQAIAMGELDAAETLMAAVEAFAGKPAAQPEKKPEPAPVQPKPVQPAPQPAPVQKPVQPEPMPKPKEGKAKPAAQPAPVQPEPTQNPEPKVAKPAPAQPKPQPVPVQPEKKAAYAPESDFTTRELLWGGVAIAKYTGAGGVVSIPPIIQGKRVKEIGYGAFEDCKELQRVVIPAGVTSIENAAFNRCSGLMSVEIPVGVTRIGNYSFSDCSSLTSVDIPEGVTSIGNSAFYGCSGLMSVSIPESVTSIGMSAFNGCSGLMSVDIPEGVTSIGNSAFYGCSGLTSVRIPESVTDLDGNPFASCKRLTTISVTANNKKYYVRDGVLMSRDNELVCYPAGLAAKSYSIPAGVTGIGEEAFSGCKNLTSVSISEDVRSIGRGAFSFCSSLANVVIPAGVMSIGKDAFTNCRSLTSVSVSEGVTSIGEGAFWYCSSLTSVSIPKSVKSIGKGAFRGCTNLPLLQKMKLKMMGAM